MKVARDLMTRSVKTFQSGETLHEAINKFMTMEVHCVPVVTPMGDIIGLITEVGLVRAALRFYFSKASTELLLHHKELMDEPTVVDSGASLQDVVKSLIQSPSHRVMVLNPQGKLAGIISPRDVLRVFTGEIKKTTDLKSVIEELKTNAIKLQDQLLDARNNVDHYKRLVEQTPTMMYGADSEGKIVFANDKVHEVLGYESGELIGMSIFAVYPKSVHRDATEGLNRIMEDGSHHPVYSTLLRKDGSKVRVELSSSALNDRVGSFFSTITVAREIDSEGLLRALHKVVDDPTLEPIDHDQDDTTPSEK